MITPMLAAKAYAAVQAQAPEDFAAAGAAGAAGSAPGTSFGDILKGVMNDTVETSKTAEAKMVAGVQGKADLVDVVTAISSAEASLETMVSVRDQMISAYQEIMRMQI
jgi:flagellar hook-basal body complex protein FliE